MAVPKKTKRDTILYAHVSKANRDWIKVQVKKLGYSPRKGKSEYLDALFTQLRNKGNPSKVPHARQ